VKEEELVLRVKDLMTRSIISISVNKSVMEAASVMTVEGLSSVLLKSENKIVGIITDHDIISRVVALGLNPKEVMTGEVMSTPLTSISEEASIEEAAERMRENKMRRLVVTNKVDIVGIIAESDIIRVAPEHHFLIRERSRLETLQNVVEPEIIRLVGFCEECKNYATDLRNVNGKWLCEECRE
jgi:signal-transduction protein with cAMP-binding, CBS, and nucleotidyltransferase domain